MSRLGSLCSRSTARQAVRSCGSSPVKFMRFLSTAFFLSCVCWAAPGAAADNPLVVEIWPGKIPDDTGGLGPEKSRMSPKLDRKQVEVTEQSRLITAVSKPTLSLYRPAKGQDTGTATVICPGGGYWVLYWQVAGEEA